MSQSSDGKRLTVHNASVTTMTVEVKTLTIGARQVTQGIFKQLIEEPLIARDGTLNGVPWGHVTWHPSGNDCGSYSFRDSNGTWRDGRDRGHRHVVWQRGDSLYRCLVYSIEAESQRLDVPSGLDRGFTANWRCAWDDYSEDTRRRHREARAALAELPQLFIGG